MGDRRWHRGSQGGGHSQTESWRQPSAPSNKSGRLGRGGVLAVLVFRAVAMMTTTISITSSASHRTNHHKGLGKGREEGEVGGVRVVVGVGLRMYRGGGVVVVRSILKICVVEQSLGLIGQVLTG